MTTPQQGITDRQRRSIETQIRTYASTMGISEDDPRYKAAMEHLDTKYLTAEDPSATVPPQTQQTPLIPNPPQTQTPPPQGQTVVPAPPAPVAVQQKKGAPGYKPVGCIIYSETQQRFREMSEFARRSGIEKGIREDSNRSLFLNVCAEIGEQLMKDDPTKFLAYVRRWTE